jgi:hypothetical protein
MSSLFLVWFELGFVCPDRFISDFKVCANHGDSMLKGPEGMSMPFMLNAEGRVSVLPTA